MLSDRELGCVLWQIDERHVLANPEGQHGEQRERCKGESEGGRSPCAACGERGEACAGDAYLYERFLKSKGVCCRGGDLNERFVAHAQRRGTPLVRHDLMHAEVPEADYVVLQASLYQFMPHELKVLQKLRSAARCALIVAEPIRNLSTSKSALVRWIAQRSANPGDGDKHRRFDERSLDALFAQHFGDQVLEAFLAPGGREKVYCLRGGAADQD